MADGDLYETDILAWSEQQAAALRELASRRDLPNALDLAHVVEEIEDVGLSQLNGVKSRTRRILEHVLKCHAEPDAPSVRHWHGEIANWQTELADRFSQSMRQRIELDGLWRQAVKVAMLEIGAPTGHASSPVTAHPYPTECPILLDNLLSEQVAPPDLVQRLRAALPR